MDAIYIAAMPAALKNCPSIGDLLQRILIFSLDVILIVLAWRALALDFKHSCEQNLRTYGLLCVGLTCLDLCWEVVRCGLDAALDRLQPAGVAPALVGGCGDEGLLEEGPVGSPDSKLDKGTDRFISRGSGTLDKGVRKEKVLKRRRVQDMHFWSLVFTAMTALIFSSLAVHDEECKEQVPHLYQYIHTFTYVFIFRIGIIILWGCCRTLKDYEDAAKMMGSPNTSPLPDSVRQEMGAMS